MSAQHKTTIGWVLAVFLLIGGLLWLRWIYFEQRLQATPYQSSAALENPMLAATRLLEQHKYRVRQSESMEQALSPDLATGHLFIGDTSGEFNSDQARQVLAWVSAGNTLIMQPRWSGLMDAGEFKRQECLTTDIPEGNQTRHNPISPQKDLGPLNAIANNGNAGDEDEGEDEGEGEDEAVPSQSANATGAKSEIRKPDPISIKLGVELTRTSYPDENRPSGINIPKPVSCVKELRLPNKNYSLRMDAGASYLVSQQTSAAPIISDLQREQGIRIYREGQGHIVLLASNYFNNRNLAFYDHAELLLEIGQLNPQNRAMVIIQQLKVRQWYQKLWDRFHLLLLSLGLGLALLLWHNMRRFGPVLPLPEPNRRALMEHIDASGRWLWKVKGGNQMLLDAMRSLTKKTLQRRIPMLAQLSPPEQIECLLQDAGINRGALELALQSPAATTPLLFIRQIQTLQRLRKHYER